MSHHPSSSPPGLRAQVSTYQTTPHTGCKKVGNYADNANPNFNPQNTHFDYITLMFGGQSLNAESAPRVYALDEGLRERSTRFRSQRVDSHLCGLSTVLHHPSLDADASEPMLRALEGDGVDLSESTKAGTFGNTSDCRKFRVRPLGRGEEVGEDETVWN